MAATANERYLLGEFQRLTPGGVALDYGCGAGRLVADAVAAGRDFWGVENYYGDQADSEWHEQVLTDTPADAGGRIKLLQPPELAIPFPDETFDFVCSNQVVEHLDNLDETLAQIRRVTKVGGTGVHVFPTREILTEPHLGVPLFHRTPHGWYARPWHRVRAANFSRNEPDWNIWWGKMGTFYRDSVRLRPYREVVAAFTRNGFTVTDASLEKLAWMRGWKRPVPGVLRPVERVRAGVTLRTIRTG